MTDNLPATTQADQHQPFQRMIQSAGTNVGAVAVEQERAIAEAQGQLILAKKFPRNLTGSHAELMESCSIRAFAETAFYSVPNRGSGPSIRFAEEVARVYGNFQYGHRELSRTEGKSEVEVYAWDMEKNNYSKRQITVLHVMDTKNGPKPLRDQADIDNKIANVASKQIRGRILALMPKWLVAEAIEKCKQTIAGNTSEPISVRVRKISQAFAKYGVTTDHLERHLGHSLDETTADELVDLIGIGNALKEGGKPSEYFTSAADTQNAGDSAATAKPPINKRAGDGAENSNAAQSTGKGAKDPSPEPESQAKPKPEKKTETKPSAPAPEPEKAQAAPEPEPTPATTPQAEAQPKTNLAPPDEDDAF